MKKRYGKLQLTLVILFVVHLLYRMIYVIHMKWNNPLDLIYYSVFGDFKQMNEQDKLSIVHGTWVRDADGRWIFEPDIACGA